MNADGSDTLSSDPQLLSAIIAAIHSYLAEEATARASNMDMRRTAWRRAVWLPVPAVPFRGSASWKRKGLFTDVR